MELLKGKYDLSNEVLKKNFSLKKFQGKWFEIARSKNWYQSGCYQSIAKYEVLEKGLISVHNVCLKDKDRMRNQVFGKGEVLDSKYPAALHVSFPDYGINFIKQFKDDLTGGPKPNFLVHDTDYQTYALIGNPDRSNFWILSREETLPEDKIDQLLKVAYDNGYYIGNVVYDGQKPSIIDRLIGFVIY